MRETKEQKISRLERKILTLTNENKSLKKDLRSINNRNKSNIEQYLIQIENLKKENKRINELLKINKSSRKEIIKETTFKEKIDSENQDNLNDYNSNMWTNKYGINFFSKDLVIQINLYDGSWLNLYDTGQIKELLQTKYKDLWSSKMEELNEIKKKDDFCLYNNSLLDFGKYLLSFYQDDPLYKQIIGNNKVF